ncbi:hypothetical protein RRG08_035232 [Elysia crispata]|uniref:Uncharacterized protein n=1 Tax=Elysia crispata TaxID=231223 RepID=A0AAE0ZN25_9GAST|nr:hypothetical protein RRG08_035232 [Elysia crispata]
MVSLALEIWTLRLASKLSKEDQEVQVSALLYSMGPEAERIYSTFELAEEFRETSLLATIDLARARIQRTKALQEAHHNMADHSRGRTVVNVVRITTTESAQLSEKNVTNVAGETISPNYVDQRC